MELRPDEIKEFIEDPLEHFAKSFKAKATKETQTYTLKKILCEFLGPVLKGDPELVRQDKLIPKKGTQTQQFSTADWKTRAREFVTRAKEDPKWTEAVIVKLMDKLTERTMLEKTHPDYLDRGSARNYYWPIQKLLESGGIELPWKRIRRHLPKQGGHGGRAWERTEIDRMLKHCDSEEKPLVIIPATSGIREGGLWFRWEHIFTVYKFNEYFVWEPRDVTEEVKKHGKIVCGLVHVYPDTQDNDDYFGLITPEAIDIIEEYRNFWISKWGKPPQPKDPFFFKHGPVIRPLKEAGMRKRMEEIQVRCGLRPKKLPEKTRRHEVQLFTGFRKFFDKATKKANSSNSVLSKLILNEKMMGHDGLIRLNRNYFREHISELIEEYLPAIPHLTVEEGARKVMQTKVQEQIKDSEIRKIVDEALLDKLDSAMELRLQKIANQELERKIQEILDKQQKPDR